MQHSWGAEAALCPAEAKHLAPATSPQGLLLNRLLAPKPVPPVSPLVSGTGPQAQEAGVVLRTPTQLWVWGSRLDAGSLP